MIMLLITANPNRYTSGTISGLKLFFFSVLPGLFPFMFLTKLLTELGFLFKITQKLDKLSHNLFGTPGVSIYAFLMSILSGYPIGAKIISDLYEKNLITSQDAQKMSVFCTTSGPIFIIGSVGSLMFGNFKIGMVLYFSHIFSSFLLGVFYHLLTKKQNHNRQENNCYKIITFSKQNHLISYCVNQTINSLFVVGAYITIFYLLGEILDALNIFNFATKFCIPLANKFNISNNDISGILYGILEVTRGAKTLSSSTSILSISFCSMILSFSGISIIMQSMAFLKNAQIKTRNFVLSKCVHSIVSFIICYLILIIL
ncbi:MAG: hypothetical protein IKB06_03080 [Clostridia bacterium]|nr:hypothetical protein [Clostridia bacterium]